MKIKLNPLDQLLKRAERRINFWKVATAQDLAHDRKRQIAQSVLAGAAPPTEFEQAARLEGMTAQQLATMIAAKPDVLMTAENARRGLIVRVRQAKTAEEIQKILEDNQIPTHPEDRVPGLLP